MGGRTDIASCFSAIPHDELMQAVQERICDESVLKLLCVMLRAGVMEGAQLRRPATGTPQGGVLSPVLCNVQPESQVNGILGDVWPRPATG